MQCWRMKATYAKQLDELSCGKIYNAYDRTNVWNLDRAQSTRPQDNRVRPWHRDADCASVHSP